MTTLTGKTIGQLISLSAITDNTLFPVEFSGKTYHIPYSAFTTALTSGMLSSGTLTLNSANGNPVVITGFTDSDNYTTGGTYNSITEELEFVGTSPVTTFNVDVSALLDDTNTYVTGGTYSIGTLTLNRNDGNSVIITGFTDNTDNYTTGGTYNSITESIDFSGNSSVTTFSVNVSQLLDDTNTFTTGATLNGNIVEFNRNDLTNAYSVDLTSLDLPTNYSNVVFVDVINGNDSTGIINDFNKPCLTVSQGITIAATLPSLSSDNRALVYIRRGNYVNPILFLQNNVDVYCEPGVVFTGAVQIRDNSVSVNSNIYGKLKINSAGSTIPFSVNGASFIYFEFDSIVSNACAIGVDIASTSNNIRIKGNSIYSNTVGQGFGITIRNAANVTLNISEKIESIHQTLRFRFYTGKTTINCPNIFLIPGNLYGGNWKQVVYLDNPAGAGEVTINGNLVCTDTTNYGSISSVVRFWDSPNATLKVNGDIVAGLIPGIALSNGAGKMILNGNISGNQTCITSSGSNKLIINNGGIVRNTDTFASPFSIGGSSEVFINNCYYYSAFYGNMINIDNSSSKLYLNNFISEGFIDITGTTGTFINVGVTTPTLGLNNVATNRDYNNSLNTSYLINLTSDSNIKVPNFF